MTTMKLLVQSLALSSLLLAPTSAQNCNICGEGNVIGNPDGIIENPGNVSQVVTCTEFQEAEELIVPALCNFLPAFAAEPCECQTPEGIPITDVETPITDVQSGPETPTCNICGEGNTLTDPDGIIQDPANPDRRVTCAFVQENATALINPKLCGAFPLFVFDTCGCVGNDPSPPDENPRCNICGEGKRITNPDGLIENPINASQTITCEVMQESDRAIPAELCGYLPTITDGICGCIETDGEMTLPPQLPEVPDDNPPCNICGLGNKIGNPVGLIQNPSNTAQVVTCQQVQDKDNLIIPDLCALLPAFVSDVCECTPTSMNGMIEDIVDVPEPTEAPSAASSRPLISLSVAVAVILSIL